MYGFWCSRENVKYLPRGLLSLDCARLIALPEVTGNEEEKSEKLFLEAKGTFFVQQKSGMISNEL